jgi:hypothetical protein
MKLILSGFLLVTSGAVLPFLMAIRMIEPSWPVSFLSYAASLSGLALGIGVLVSYMSGRYYGHHHDDARVTERVRSRTSRRESRAGSPNVSDRELSGNTVSTPKGPSLHRLPGQ